MHRKAFSVFAESTYPCHVFVRVDGLFRVAVNAAPDMALAGTQFSEPILAALRLMWDTL